MTNRFDQNTQQQYQSTYVPLPLEYLSGIAKNMQGDYDKGLHATDEVGKLAAAIKYSPKGAELANNYINGAKQKITDLYNSTKNYSDPEFLRKANQLTSELANDPVVQALATEKQLYDANVKESMDPNNAKNLYYTYNKDSNGNVIPAKNINELPQFNKVTKFEDYDESYKKLLSRIAPDGNKWEGNYDLNNVKTTNNGETTVLNKSNGSYEGVSAKKLANVSNIVLPNAIKTVAGKHQFESILRDKFGFGDSAYNYSYEDLSKKAANGDEQANLIKDTVDNEILSTVIASGAHQVGRITSSGNEQHFMDNRSKIAENQAKEAIATQTNPWNLLAGQANPEPEALNGVLSAIKSNFKFNSKGELEEKTPLESSYKENNKVNSYTDKNTGIKYDLNNLPSGWKVKTNKHIKEQSSDIIVNDKGEEINLTSKAYNGEFSHNFGSSSIKTYSPSEGYVKQQQEVLSFLKNTDQFDSKKSAYDNYKSGIKLYGDAIKSGKLNSISVPEFDAVTAKAFEDYYLPKFTENKDGELSLKDAGRTSQWTIEGIDKNTEEGQKEFQSMVAGANVVGPDLIKGGSHILMNTRDGRMISVDLNSKTMEANFQKLSEFNKKNNEAIYKADKVQSHKDFMNATLTTKDHQSTVDQMQNEMIGLAQKHSPNELEQVVEQLKDDNLVINNLANNLLKSKYSALNTFYDKESNTLALSFINRQDPNNPDIQVIEYQPGAQPAMVNHSVFNRDMYQKLFGNFAANTSDKSSKFSGSNLNTQNPSK